VADYDRRQVLGLLGLGALGAVVATSACTPTRRVLVIGDSLTLGAQQQDLGARKPWAWTVDAREGRGTNEGVAVAKQLSISSFQQVVVALGTNDYLDTKAAYASRIDAMMAVLPVPRVVWINVDAGTAKLAPAALGVNPALKAAPARYRKLAIGDWDAYLRSRTDPDQYRAADQVHYNAAGYALRARWMESLVTG